MLVVCLAIDALVLLTVFASEGDEATYARTVDQALAEVGRTPARVVRVRGLLVGGSLVATGACAWRFRLRPELVADGDLGGGERQLSVNYRACRLPDTFCDLPTFELTLHATGRLVETGSSWSLEADSAMASCPTKYSVSRSVCEDAPEAARRSCGMCSAGRTDSGSDRE
jgi:CcmE